MFGPVTTLWGFLSQVLSDDHSCRDAVSRVIAHRAASGLEPCSPNAASYCNARTRLPTGVLRTLAKRTARQLQGGLPQAWKWNGAVVTSVEENQIIFSLDGETARWFAGTVGDRLSVLRWN